MAEESGVDVATLAERKEAAKLLNTVRGLRANEDWLTVCEHITECKNGLVEDVLTTVNLDIPGVLSQEFKKGSIHAFRYILAFLDDAEARAKETLGIEGEDDE